MSAFKKLINGNIIFVTKITPETIHGYNLKSPNLKQKNFRFSSIDQQNPPDNMEKWIAFKEIDRTYPQECRHHSANVTAVRTNKVVTTLRQEENKQTRVPEPVHYHH